MTGKPVIIKAAGPATASGALLSPAAAAFREGGVVAYPTETFYGLCADPFNPVAIERLFTLKGRPTNNPVALIIADLSMLDRLTEDVTPAAAVLIKKFWPGPLTLVMKAAPALPATLIANSGKIGVRLSSHPLARALSELCSSPITATSANPAGRKPPASAKDVLGYFGSSLDVLIDGGKLAGRLGSTVVDVSGDKTAVLREGEIPASKIFEALA